MENNNSQRDHIDVIAIFKTLWQRRKVFYWVLPITFVLSAALILCVPRYYKCEVLLAPEAQAAGAGGSLQTLASSFGFNMSNLASSDAIYPLIYPDVVNSPDFLVHLFDIQVKTSDDEFVGSYYQYMNEKQKKAFWSRWKNNIKKWLTPKKKELNIETASDNNDGIHVFYLTQEQWDVINAMRGNIKCSYNKKSQEITFIIKAQDPLVCAQLADSVCAGLQIFITEYRTAKYRNDLQYYENIMDTAYREYQEASYKYTSYVDSHGNMYLEQYRIKAKNLETEMQLKQSAYTSFQKQYLATQARLQENTPVFTVLQSASVPPRPAGPRRTIFVLAMLFLATFVTSCVVCKELLVEMFL